MPTVHHCPTTDDETLAKLETAFEQAESIDLRGALRSAIKERKSELRQQANQSA